MKDFRIEAIWVDGREFSELFTDNGVSVGGNFVNAVNGREMRCVFKDLRVFAGNVADDLYGFGKAVKFDTGVTFSRLDHEAEDFGEGNRRRVKPEVQKEFSNLRDDLGAGDAGGFDPVEVFEAPRPVDTYSLLYSVKVYSKIL